MVRAVNVAGPAVMRLLGRDRGGIAGRKAAIRTVPPMQVKRQAPLDERSWRVIELALGFVALLAAFALNGR